MCTSIHTNIRIYIYETIQNHFKIKKFVNFLHTPFVFFWEERENRGEMYLKVLFRIHTDVVISANCLHFTDLSLYIYSNRFFFLLSLVVLILYFLQQNSSSTK